MIRVYYREMFQDDLETARLAIEVGKKTFELSEFIVDQLGVTDLAAALRENLAIPGLNALEYY